MSKEVSVENLNGELKIGIPVTKNDESTEWSLTEEEVSVIREEAKSEGRSTRIFIANLVKTELRNRYF